MGEAADQRFVFDLGSTTQQDGFRFGRLEKAQGDAAPAEKRGGAQRELTHEIGQVEDGVQLECQRDQDLGATAVLLRLVEIASTSRWLERPLHSPAPTDSGSRRRSRIS